MCQQEEIHTFVYVFDEKRQTQPLKKLNRAPLTSLTKFIISLDIFHSNTLLLV